uniref:Dynein, axonemal, intermediate chain 1, paralog 2 n=1 Tax=Amphiprion ocellaris TaxID=80972 RepID=A0AAQ5ZJF0_AMPOC
MYSRSLLYVMLQDEEKTVEIGGGHIKGLIKPPDQLKLTEAYNTFSSHLTKAKPNIFFAHIFHIFVSCFSQDRCFKPCVVDHTIHIFELEGNLVYKNSDEGRRLMLKQGLHEGTTNLSCVFSPQTTPVEDGGEVEEAGEEDRPDSAASKTDKKEPKITNIFNSCDRATQTLHNPPREINCQTEPPPRSSFSASANQWEIYDAYVQELQKQEKNKEKQKAAPSEKDEKSQKKMMLMETQDIDLNKVSKAAKVLERMVNLNIFDEIAQDFAYYEDPADEFKFPKGTLLPLWKVKYDQAKKLSVTALCWNNKYPDLFGVGMGSYNFCKQGSGMLLFYTYKNCSFPEYIYPTSSGVLCLDIHEERTYLVAVGFYDGSVAVYNLKTEGKEPIYKSTAKTGKHTAPVWQVCWQNDDMDSNHNFYSVSSDGRVVSWTLVKVSQRNIFYLHVTPLIACGTSMDFHKQIDYLFLVGTQEGKIYKCKTYSSKILETYDAHHMRVDTVKWNHFHPKVFISCSSDWTIKITPVLTFDLKEPIGDIAWSPYSSTVFAAVTTDGNVHVFDLNINKYEALCQQLVVDKKKAKLTHIAFNPIHPIIIVGDDRGNVNSFKLSPNLRKKPKVRTLTSFHRSISQ